MHTLRHARTFIRMHTNAPMHDAHSNKKKEEAYDEINLAQISFFSHFASSRQVCPGNLLQWRQQRGKTLIYTLDRLHHQRHFELHNDTHTKNCSLIHPSAVRCPPSLKCSTLWSTSFESIRQAFIPLTVYNTLLDFFSRSYSLHFHQSGSDLSFIWNIWILYFSIKAAVKLISALFHIRCTFACDVKLLRMCLNINGRINTCMCPLVLHPVRM